MADPTREQIKQATEAFLAEGGIIRHLPDTVEEQKAWLALLDHAGLDEMQKSLSAEAA